MSDENITIKVKMTSNNATYDIPISTGATILELKKALTTDSSLKESEQNLVYKGRILADDKLISDYKIQNEHTVILVKKFSQTNQTSTNTNTTTNTNTNTTGSTSNTTSNTTNPFSNLGGQGLGGLSGLGGLGGLGGMDPSQLSGMMNNPQYMSMMSEVYII